MDGELTKAIAGQAVTLTLDQEIDISRGDLLADPLDRPVHADQFRARLVLMHEEPLLPGREYLIKCGTTLCPAQVTDLKEKVDVNTLEHHPAKTLSINEVGIVNVSVGRDISFDAYEHDPSTGGFILIDRMTNATVGAGMIDYALRRASNIHLHDFDVDKAARAEMLGQTPRCVWFTGLSGSGKSTIADLVAKKLHAEGKLTYILDGDNVRHGLNRDLGFTDADRVENIRRVAETAKLMVDAGVIVICSFISPFTEEATRSPPKPRESLFRKARVILAMDGRSSGASWTTLSTRSTEASLSALSTRTTLAFLAGSTLSMVAQAHG